jgi:hypothetical protein
MQGLGLFQHFPYQYLVESDSVRLALSQNFGILAKVIFLGYLHFLSSGTILRAEVLRFYCSIKEVLDSMVFISFFVG